MSNFNAYLKKGMHIYTIILWKVEMLHLLHYAYSNGFYSVYLTWIDQVHTCDCPEKRRYLGKVNKVELKKSVTPTIIMLT